MGILTRNRLGLLLVALAVALALLALGITRLLGGATGPAVAHAATVQGKQRHHVVRHQARRRAVRHRVRARSAQSTTATDGDTVQSGDQSAPDNGARGESSGESSSESVGEQPGDGPGGYVDPPGQNVDHQCPPACGAGEQG